MTDIDPFVLNLAPHGTSHVPASVVAFAIIVAASANNVAKVLYALIYSAAGTGVVPLLALGFLAVCGLGFIFVQGSL